MKPLRPKVEQIRHPTLFQMEKLEEAGKPAKHVLKLTALFTSSGSTVNGSYGGKKLPLISDSLRSPEGCDARKVPRILRHLDFAFPAAKYRPSVN